MATYGAPDALQAPIVHYGNLKHFSITGITPDDFIEMYGELEFDMIALQNEFKKYCKDYKEPLMMDKKSKAVEFCSKIIYEVIPESRKMKKETVDKIWNFNFLYNEDETKYTVLITKYKQKNLLFTTDNQSHNMTLSLKEAGLIAQETFSRLIKWAYSQGQKLMTPQSDAYFNKDNMLNLANELNLEEDELLIRISQSTQNGGYILEQFDVDIAMCALLAATINVKNKNIRKSILVKALGYYINKGFVPNKKRIDIIAKYTTGGIPAEFALEELIKEI